ncbi:MAG: hypothetical protein ABI867_26360 [Kofleriaceae bacterium]
MRVLALVVVAGCGSSFDPGASVDIDGAVVELPAITAVKQGTLLDLTATADDGTRLTISFPAATAPGPHDCLEGVDGIFSIVLVDAAAEQFASFYPISSPAHECSFELDVNDGDTVELSALTAPLANSAGDAMRALADGSFAAEIQ